MTHSSSPIARIRARRTIVTFVLAALALIACAEPPAPTAPAIASFVADPPATGPGQVVTLSWQVTSAASLQLLPGDVDVTGLTQFAVNVDADTTFTLVAENALGTDSRQVSVAVGPLPTIASFTTSGPTASGGLVNPGLGTTLSWSTAGADTVTLQGPGLGAGLDVTAMTSYDVAALAAGAEYTLVAANAFGAVEVDVTAARTVPAFSVLIAGQSNAQGVNLSASAANAFITATPFVRMLGNDYVWKAAYEPLDDCTNQVDSVSVDCGSGVSSGVSLGNRTSAATGGTVFLIPAARGGTSATAWLPQADPYDRSTLFGSAAHRARLAGLEQGAPLGLVFEGVPYGAVVWYQGETDSDNTTLVNAFATRTRTILDAFRAELGAPTILVQLSRRGSVNGEGADATAARNFRYQLIREIQRRLATGARTADGAAASGTLPSTYLVVTHDLPMHPGDGRHLSAAGQVELGRRIDLAIREHLLGDATVDGSGPQLLAVEKPSNTEVRVRTSQPLRPPSLTTADAYGGYFAVISGDDAVPISAISLLPGDSSVVRITLSGAGVPGAVEVRYMPPPGIITSLAADVIRSATCDEPIPNTALCLPMAAFGDAFSSTEDITIQSFQVYDVE